MKNHLEKIQTFAAMALLISILTSYASWKGLADPTVYEDVCAAGTISKLLVVGSTAQDLISLPLGILLGVFSLFCMKRQILRLHVAMLGISTYFSYAYGLYVIQGQYTSLYLVYLAIFGLSIYGLVFGLTALKPDLIEQIRLPRWVAYTISAFLIAIILLLTPVWLIRMGPDLAAHVPSDVYGVFVLDLAVVFPAFAVTASYLIRQIPFGTILAGIALVKTFTLCLSVFIGESMKPGHGFEADVSMIAIFGGLTVLSGCLGTIYLRMLGPCREAPLSERNI